MIKVNPQRKKTAFGEGKKRTRGGGYGSVLSSLLVSDSNNLGIAKLDSHWSGRGFRLVVGFVK